MTASASPPQESTKASSSDASCVPETLFELTHAGEYTLGVVDGSRPGCIASSSWAEAASWLASEDDPAEAEEWCGGHNITVVEGESSGALLRAWYHVRHHRRVKTRKSDAGRLDKASAEVAIVISTKSRQVEATLRQGIVEVHVAAAAVAGKKGGGGGGGSGGGSGGGGGGGGGAAGPCFSPFSALLPTSLLPSADLYGERPVHGACALVSPAASAAARAKLRPDEAVFALEDGSTLPNEVMRVWGARLSSEALAGRLPPHFAAASAASAAAAASASGGGGGGERAALLLHVRDKASLGGLYINPHVHPHPNLHHSPRSRSHPLHSHPPRPHPLSPHPDHSPSPGEPHRPRRPGGGAAGLSTAAARPLARPLPRRATRGGAPTAVAGRLHLRSQRGAAGCDADVRQAALRRLRQRATAQRR